MSAAARKLPVKLSLTERHRRQVAMLEKINELSNEFAALRGTEDDAVEALDNGIATARDVVDGEWGRS